MLCRAMHVKLGHFSDDDAYLILPDELAGAEHIDVTVFHGDGMVLQARLRVQHFKNWKAFLSLPCTSDIIWQHGERVIIGVTGSDSIEIVRSAKYYEQIAIGPEDVDLTD